MKKINIAELLKDCPHGMELDCTMYDNVILGSVNIDDLYPIVIANKSGYLTSLTEYGQNTHNKDSKCVIFPKGKTTWEGFVPPCKFKDGDILYAIDEGNEFIFILKHIDKSVGRVYCYLSLKGDDLRIQEVWLTDYNTTHRLATEEEKQKLFKAIKDNGYRWNDETKTLEKLFKAKFKVGDRVKSNYNNNQYNIIGVTNTHYTLEEVKHKYKYVEPIIEDKNLELVPNKFDFTTLKPLESKVLMRSSNAREWVGTIYSHYNNKKFYGCGMCCDQCIPYEGNEHLLGTTDDCEEFYKTW